MSGTTKLRYASSIIIGLLLSVPLPIWALGFGEIESTTLLNEPLNARISYSAQNISEVTDLNVTLATPEEFANFNLDYPNILNQLGFKVVSTGKKSGFIEIFSNVPINEPFLNFIIKASYSGGSLLREYTLLLDPPIFRDRKANRSPFTQRSQQPQQPQQPLFRSNAAPPVPRSTNRGTYVAQLPDLDAPLNSVPPQNLNNQAPLYPNPNQFGQPGQPSYRSGYVPPQSDGTNYPNQPGQQIYNSGYQEPPLFSIQDQGAQNYANQGGYNYGPVGRGESLWGIANRYRPAGVTTQQMLVTIWQANRQAFYRDNMNALSAGARLQIPAINQYSQLVHPSQAIATVKSHHNDWARISPGFQYAESNNNSGTGRNNSANNNSQTSSNTKNQSLKILGGVDDESVAASVGGGNKPIQLAQMQRDLLQKEEELSAQRMENEEILQRLKALEDIVSQKDEQIKAQNDLLNQLQNELARISQGKGGTADLGAGSRNTTANNSASTPPKKTLKKSSSREGTRSQRPRGTKRPVVLLEEDEPGLIDTLLSLPVIGGFAAIVCALLGFFLFRRYRANKASQEEYEEEGYEEEDEYTSSSRARTPARRTIADAEEIGRQLSDVDEDTQDIYDESDPELEEEDVVDLTGVLDEADPDFEALEEDSDELELTGIYSDEDPDFETVEKAATEDTVDGIYDDSDPDFDAIEKAKREKAKENIGNIEYSDADLGLVYDEVEDDDKTAADIGDDWAQFDKAELIVRKKIEQTPDNPEYKISLLNILYAVNDEEKFEQEAKILQDLVGEDDERMGPIHELWAKFKNGRGLFEAAVVETETIDDSALDLDALAVDGDNLPKAGGESEQVESEHADLLSEPGDQPEDGLGEEFGEIDDELALGLDETSDIISGVDNSSNELDGSNFGDLDDFGDFDDVSAESSDELTDALGSIEEGIGQLDDNIEAAGEDIEDDFADFAAFGEEEGEELAEDLGDFGGELGELESDMQELGEELGEDFEEFSQEMEEQAAESFDDLEHGLDEISDNIDAVGEQSSTQVDQFGETLEDGLEDGLDELEHGLDEVGEKLDALEENIELDIEGQTDSTEDEFSFDLDALDDTGDIQDEAEAEYDDDSILDIHSLEENSDVDDLVDAGSLEDQDSDAIDFASIENNADVDDLEDGRQVANKSEEEVSMINLDALEEKDEELVNMDQLFTEEDEQTTNRSEHKKEEETSDSDNENYDNGGMAFNVDDDEKMEVQTEQSDEDASAQLDTSEALAFDVDLDSQPVNEKDSSESSSGHLDTSDALEFNVDVDDMIENQAESSNEDASANLDTSDAMEFKLDMDSIIEADEKSNEDASAQLDTSDGLDFIFEDVEPKNADDSDDIEQDTSSFTADDEDALEFNLDDGTFESDEGDAILGVVEGEIASTQSKLDLVKAYIDMGNNDEARRVLTDIKMNDTNKSNVALASKLLSTLD